MLQSSGGNTPFDLCCMVLMCALDVLMIDTMFAIKKKSIILFLLNILSVNYAKWFVLL